MDVRPASDEARERGGWRRFLLPHWLIGDPALPPAAGKVAPRRRSWLRRPLTWVIVAVLLIGSLGSAGAGWALNYGGYCADEFLPGSVSFEVPPYVQDVTQTSAVVVWQTVIETDGAIAWGETPALGRATSGGNGGRHAAHLTGLKPDTTYYYQIGAGTVIKMEDFRTMPGPEGALTFGVLGDSGTGGADQRALAGVLVDLKPRLIVHTGDVVYERGAACFYQRNFYEPYAGLIPNVPVFPVLGNHDLRSEHGKPYFNAFDLPTDNPQQTERYYSFDAGPVHFVGLDSELYHGDGPQTAAQQKAWLEQDLAQTRLPWKVVSFHRPVYSDSQHGGDDKIRADLAPIFARYGVALVLNGHDHAYERFHPIAGVTYVVTGGGGAPLYDVGRSAETAYAAKVHHVLEVVAAPKRLTLEAIGEDGKVFDRVDLAK